MHPIAHHLAAGYPAVAVATADESAVATALSAAHRYSASGALVAPDGRVVLPRATWPEAFAWAAAGERRLLLCADAQHVLAHAPVYRALLDVLPRAKAAGSTILLVAPAWRLPPELEHVLPVVHWPLPSRDQREAVLRGLAQSQGLPLAASAAAALLDASSGLTLEEAENAYALALAERGELAADVVWREKVRRLASGPLTVAAPAAEADVGGLDLLRGYFREEVVPSSGDDLLRVRGVMLVGVPGTGKSLAARVAAGVLGWPVLRLDVAGCRGSLVGQSEQQLRHALATAEDVAPAVLWLDEIEKAVGGYASSAKTDGGTTLGMVGYLLTWLQEHRSPITVVATCNDYSALPPELTRAGRFDERFFVDLPHPAERQAIAAVHLRRLGADEGLAAEVPPLSDSWTGAEIEQCVVSAARRTRRKISPEALRASAAEIRPIARVRAREIQELRAWAADALRPANAPPQSHSAASRRIGGVA